VAAQCPITSTGAAVHMVLEPVNTCVQETRSAKNHRRAEKRAAKKTRTAAASDAEFRAHGRYEECEVSSLPQAPSSMCVLRHLQQVACD
jgi:hypothetical protein